jgi:hypothetical protein
MLYLGKNLLRKPGQRITAPQIPMSENWRERKPTFNKL